VQKLANFLQLFHDHPKNSLGVLCEVGKIELVMVRFVDPPLCSNLKPALTPPANTNDAWPEKSPFRCTTITKQQIQELVLEGSIIRDAGYLVESIFPDEQLPTAPTADLLHDIYDVFHSVMHPSLESDIGAWLNCIREVLASYFKEPSLDRKWDTGNFASPLKGSTHKCKPNVMLLDKSLELEPT